MMLCPLQTGAGIGGMAGRHHLGWPGSVAPHCKWGSEDRDELAETAGRIKAGDAYIDTT